MMLVELVGSGGVGKTTVEPLIASRLGITYYPAKHDDGFEDDESLGSWQVLERRIASLVHNPMLFARSAQILDHPLRSRIQFALDTTSRDRLASQAGRFGSGVLASGPVHGLCAASARYRCDTTSLVTYVRHADAYVHLTVGVDEISRRLRQRRDISDEQVVKHWHNYNEAVVKVFRRLDRPLLEVEATPEPNEVAAEVARRLQPLLEMDVRP